MRLFHVAMHLASASLRGRQFASPKFPLQINVPKHLTLSEVHSKGTGLSGRRRQPPNQRPSHLSRFSLEPEPLSKRAYVWNTTSMALSEDVITETSSAYNDRTGRGVDIPGRVIPWTPGDARILQASTSMLRT